MSASASFAHFRDYHRDRLKGWVAARQRGRGLQPTRKRTAQTATVALRDYRPVERRLPYGPSGAGVRSVPHPQYYKHAYWAGLGDSTNCSPRFIGQGQCYCIQLNRPRRIWRYADIKHASGGLRKNWKPL